MRHATDIAKAIAVLLVLTGAVAASIQFAKWVSHRNAQTVLDLSFLEDEFGKPGQPNGTRNESDTDLSFLSRTTPRHPSPDDAACTKIRQSDLNFEIEFVKNSLWGSNPSLPLAFMIMENLLSCRISADRAARFRSQTKHLVEPYEMGLLEFCGKRTELNPLAFDRCMTQYGIQIQRERTNALWQLFVAHTH